MGNRRALLAVVAACLAVFVGLAGLLIVVSEDVRATLRLADAVVNPPPTVRPDPVVLVNEVRSLARLETTSMRLAHRIRGHRGTDGTWGLLGERLDFLAHAVVTAGVDLEQLGESDLVVDEEGVVHVRLPDAEIFHVDLDEEATFVASRERGWLGWPDKDLESAVRKEAVDSLREFALEQGILDKADAQAQAVIEDLLKAGGVERVVFE